MKLLMILFLCSAAPAVTLRYWVEPCTGPQQVCHKGDPELAEWALRAWESAAHGELAFEKTSDREKAQIRIFWSGGHDGLYGETRPILVAGLRGGEVYVLPPPQQSSTVDELLRDAIVYLSCLHETGHALGLDHTADFADIMYSFQLGGNIPEYFGRYRRLLSTRADIAKHTGMSEGDRQRIIAKYRHMPEL